ncbi:hypothetical protein SRIMM317S_04560 [Streptomyces rimosus subsp. rimosus]
MALEAPLFAVYGPGGRTRRRALLRCLLFGETQSVSGDPAGALRALVDIALKALSPAVNDPGRAVQVLDHIEDLLVLLAPRTAPEPAAGTAAFTHRTRSWADYVCIGTDEIRHFGAASVQVQRRLRALYATVVPLCGPELGRAGRRATGDDGRGSPPPVAPGTGPPPRRPPGPAGPGDGERQRTARALTTAAGKRVPGRCH